MSKKGKRGRGRLQGEMLEDKEMQKGDEELLTTDCRRCTERRVNGAHTHTHAYTHTSRRRVDVAL